MDLFQAMQIFSSVASDGSMTASGKRLGLSKAMVSRSVAELENHLNVRLFNRTTRRISLTEAGAAYLDHCREMLERNEAAECQLAEVSQRVSGTLRVNAPINYGTHSIVPLIADFLSEHEELCVELELTDRFVDLVEEGVDLLIRIGTALPETAIARKIGEARINLVASPALIARQGNPGTLDALADWPRLTYPARARPGSLDARGREVMRSNNGEVLVAMAEAGLGYTYSPDFLCDEAVKAGRLVKLFETEACETLPIHAVWPHRKHLSFKTRTFLDYLVRKLK